MPVIINASSTSGLVISNDMSGQLQFQNNGVNLPMSGVAPAFSAFLSTNQSCTSSVQTKLIYNTKDFDTNTNYSTSTGRFTPTVAGYYYLTAGVDFATTASLTRLILLFWKNGVQYSIPMDATSGIIRLTSSILVYLNGTTDYMEVYTYPAGTTPVCLISQASCFSGFLVRGV